MCLETITKRKTRRKTGYKLLHPMPYRVLATGYINGNSQILRVGEWVADNTDIHTISMQYSSDTYPSGFHIFLSKKDAEYFKDQMSWTVAVIRKVRFKDVVATGRQLRMNIVVARTIMLMKE